MFDLNSITSSLGNQLFFQGKQGNSSLVDPDSPAKITPAANAESVIVSLTAVTQSYFYESRIQATEPIASVETAQNKSPEQTAQNILGAIREKLLDAKDSGADQKEIRSLLEDANRGFNKGFREASKQLGQNGLLNKQLEDELVETKNLVTRGLKDLQQEFAPSKSATDEQATESGSAVAKIAADISTQVSLIEQTNFSQSFALANRNTHSALQGLSQSYSGAYSGKQSAFIEITTRDGDVITIDLTAAIDASKTFDSNGDFEASITEQNSGQFVIEGVLDEDELSALNDLLAQVDSLAGKFFGGDVAAAFQQAQDMGFNTDEIAGFSLDFSQSSSVHASVAYLENAGAGEAAGQIQNQSGFFALAAYAFNLQQALDTAGEFSQSANLLSALLSNTIKLLDDVPSISETETFNTVNDQLIEGIKNL